MMLERGIRGGITHISRRYAEANNKYMVNYNPDKPSTYIQYQISRSEWVKWQMSSVLMTYTISSLKVWDQKIHCLMYQ